MASRRNSESVFHGAVAIAAAVPQLMVHPGNSMSTSNIPATTSGYPENKLTSSASAASQDNLVNVESTMMSSSTSRIGMISHKKSLKAYYYDKHIGLHFVQYQFERLAAVSVAPCSFVLAAISNLRWAKQIDSCL